MMMMTMMMLLFLLLLHCCIFDSHVFHSSSGSKVLCLFHPLPPPAGKIILRHLMKIILRHLMKIILRHLMKIILRHLMKIILRCCHHHETPTPIEFEATPCSVESANYDAERDAERNSARWHLVLAYSKAPMAAAAAIKQM